MALSMLEGLTSPVEYLNLLSGWVAVVREGAACVLVRAKLVGANFTLKERVQVVQDFPKSRNENFPPVFRVHHPPHGSAKHGISYLDIQVPSTATAGF